MKLFLICGKAEAGKNEFANYLKNEFEKKGKRVCLLQITKPLYEYAKNYFGWNGEDENKPRRFLQTMGIEVIREKMGWKFFLIDRLCEDITILDNFFDIGIITDGRMHDEFDELKRRYGDIKIIYIKRDRQNNLTQEEQRHITEIDLDKDYDYDYRILNSSFAILADSAKEIVEKNIG